jgi:hypothetical protein
MRTDCCGECLNGGKRKGRDYGGKCVKGDFRMCAVYTVVSGM